MSGVIQQDPGTRSTRRRAHRRRRALKSMLIILLIAAVIGGAATLIARQATRSAAKGTSAGVERQHTVLVAMTLHNDLSEQAAALTLFGVDANGKNPVVLFIPVGSLAPIPGAQDIDMVGKALSVGQPSLEQITIENMLGITIDRTVAIDDVSLGAFVDALGGIDVDVQERLYAAQPDGTQTLQVPLGRHHMSGAAAVTYLTYQSADTTELDSFVRAQKVWEGIFAAGATKLGSSMRAFGSDTLSSDDAAALSGVWRAFAARSADDRTYEVLPGQEIGGGGPNVSYQVDDGKIADLVKRDFAGSVPAGVTVDARPRMDLRNGNGSPEIGQSAAAVLVPAGFHIEYTGNAPNFDFRSTKIVIYSDDEQSLALGRRIREILGVGSVEVGTRAQTVVDVTVVLGKDYLEKVRRS
ncbi:MAG: LCP family protein [Actinomycetota bacterium]